MSSSPTNKRNCALVVLMAVAAVVFSSPNVHAAAETIQAPLPPASASICVPPGAYTSGHLQITTRFTVDATGIHLGVETNSAGAKLYVPDLGEFVSNESNEHETNVNFLGATEYTIHDSFRYTSPGKAENYRLDIETHLTINANGEVSAEV